MHVYFKRLAPYFASLARYSLTSNSRSRSGFTSLRAKVFPYSAARFVAPRPIDRLSSRSASYAQRTTRSQVPVTPANLGSNPAGGRREAKHE